MMFVICHRWMDEVKGERCVLEHGHAGECAAVYVRRDPIKDGWPERDDPRWADLA